MPFPALLLVAAIALSADPSPVAALPRAQSYSHFLMAKRALADNDYARAIDEFALARNLDPASPIIRVELGEVFLRLRRYKDAAREAQKAVDLDPKNENALDLVAQIYESLGETDKALEALRRLVDTHPGQSIYLVRMAAIQDRAGNTDEAVKLLEEAVAGDPRSTDAVFELVERFQGQGKINRAIETLERAATADPDNLYVRSKLAELYLGLRDERRGRQALEAMVAIQPANVQVLLEVARAFRQLDDDGRAARLYRKALSLKPDDDAIRSNLAASLTRSRSFREALGEYRKLTATLEAEGGTGHSAERFDLLKRTGWLEVQVGELKAAIASLESARALAPPDDTDFVRLLARAYELSGEPKKALELLTERTRGKALGEAKNADLFVGRIAFLILTGEEADGLKLYKELAAAQSLEVLQHAYVSYALWKKGRSEQADEILRGALKSAPTEEKGIYLYVGSMLFEAKEKAAGFRVIESLLGRYPDDRDLYIQLARTHDRQGDLVEAARVLEKVVALYPDDADLHFQLGATYERLKRRDDAERELVATITLEPEHGNALNYVAYMYAERGEKLDKALEYARRAVALEPESGAFLDTLGWALYKAGQFEEARTNLEAAAERIPDDPVVRDHLGDVLSQLGDHAGARREYGKALELPANEPVPGLREKLDRERLLLGGTTGDRKSGE